ncbi:MAG: sigma-70 family RNA polymerase sigma factor [Phycisphaera sp.]|nr:MAG: sigma-70 family RNA polymerase sigma factor [Phycisphaera sp.]
MVDLSPDPVTTTLLLSRLGDSSDQSAWVEFDARFRRVILSVALRFGLARTDAEEAAQETMLQAYRDYQEGKYDRTRGRLSSWLISIAHHRIIDMKRRDRGRASGLAEDIESIPQNEVMQAFEKALERTVFEDAWSWLVEHTRGSDDGMLAFELTAMRGVPVSEAASQCGMSVDQVYVARSRITARLREAAERINQAFRDGL